MRPAFTVQQKEGFDIPDSASWPWVQLSHLEDSDSLQQLTGPTSGVSDSVGLSRGWRICRRLPTDAGAAGPGATPGLARGSEGLECLGFAPGQVSYPSSRLGSTGGHKGNSTPRRIWWSEPGRSFWETDSRFRFSREREGRALCFRARWLGFHSVSAKSLTAPGVFHLCAPARVHNSLAISPISGTRTLGPEGRDWLARQSSTSGCPSARIPGASAGPSAADLTRGAWVWKKQFPPSGSLRP